MLDGTQSGCINHPGVESTTRCKQCGRPVCNTCVVQGPTGRFCSAPCKQKHETFSQSAQAQDVKGRKPLFTQAKNFVVTLIIVAAVLGAIGVACTVFEVPVLSDLTRSVRGMIGV